MESAPTLYSNAAGGHEAAKPDIVIYRYRAKPIVTAIISRKRRPDFLKSYVNDSSRKRRFVGYIRPIRRRKP
jgi:hypothetical protein